MARRRFSGPTAAKVQTQPPSTVKTRTLSVLHMTCGAAVTHTHLKDTPKKALLKTGVGGLGPGSMGSTRGDRGVASSVSRDWTSSTRASGTRSNIRQPCRARRAGSNIKVRGGGGAQVAVVRGAGHRASGSGLLRSLLRFLAFQVAGRRRVSLAFSAGRRLVALRDLLLVVQEHAAQRPPDVF